MASAQTNEDRMKRSAAVLSWAAALLAGAPLPKQQVGNIEVILRWEKGQKK